MQLNVICDLSLDPGHWEDNSIVTAEKGEC